MLDHLLGKGLQREPPSREELSRFLQRIATRLTDARNPQVSLDSRFDLAYEALLQIGLAALRANGLRPDSRGGHHVLALQTLDSTIGYPACHRRLLDEFRRKRAAGLYDGSFSPSQAEVTALVQTVETLVAHFREWLHREHPELE